MKSQKRMIDCTERSPLIPKIYFENLKKITFSLAIEQMLVFLRLIKYLEV